MPPTLRDPDVAFRDETQDDAPFAESLFASLHAPQMRMMGLPAELIAMLTRQQYAIHREQQRAQFPDAVQWIITRGGVPVGRVCLDRASDEFRLVDIALLPEERGRGLGGTVIQAILDEAHAARRDVTLHVRRDNPARHLYLRLGFEIASRDEASEFMRWTAARHS